MRRLLFQIIAIGLVLSASAANAQAPRLDMTTTVHERSSGGCARSYTSDALERRFHLSIDSSGAVTLKLTLQAQLLTGSRSGGRGPGRTGLLERHEWTGTITSWDSGAFRVALTQDVTSHLYSHGAGPGTQSLPPPQTEVRDIVLECTARRHAVYPPATNPRLAVYADPNETATRVSGYLCEVTRDLPAPEYQPGALTRHSGDGLPFAIDVDLSQFVAVETFMIGVPPRTELLRRPAP